MSTSQVSKSQFKAKALELFRQVEASGSAIVVTDHGEPTVEVRPFRQPGRPSPLERLRGTVQHFDKPLEPVGVEDWDAAA